MNPTPEQLADAELEMTEARDRVAHLGAQIADLFAQRLDESTTRLQSVPVPRLMCQSLVLATRAWRAASADYALLFLASHGHRIPPGLRLITVAEDAPATPDEASAPEGGAA